MPKSQSISYIWRWNLKIKLCTINKTAPVIMSETILNNVITWSIYMDNTDYTTLKIYTCKYKGIHWTLFHKMDNLLSLCCQKSVNGWYAENSSLKMKYNWIRDQCTVHPVVVYFTGGGGRELQWQSLFHIWWSESWYPLCSWVAENISGYRSQTRLAMTNFAIILFFFVISHKKSSCGGIGETVKWRNTNKTWGLIKKYWDRCYKKRKLQYQFGILSTSKYSFWSHTL